MADARYPFWSIEELEELRQQALGLTIKRYERGRDDFAEIQEQCRTKVKELFEATDHLRDLGKDSDLFKKRPEFLEPARFTTSPPISAGNLELVAEGRGLVGTIAAFLDRERFPWLDRQAGEPETEVEIELAVHVTAQLWARTKQETAQRKKSAKTQEETVWERLAAAGMEYVEPKEIRTRLRSLGDDPSNGLMPGNYQEVLKRNEFTREIHVAGAKCDVPARLPNGSLLPIECKVSNTPSNSVKRLNRESVGKAQRWRDAFSSGVYTGVVLAGAFKMINLESAQREGALIFFDHDLDALSRFLAAGGVPRPLR